MKILKLSVQVTAATFVAFVLPFLFFSVCGFSVPHPVETLAVCAVYLLPVMIILLVIYVSAVGIGGFMDGLRSRSTSRLIVAFSYLVFVGFIVASIIRLSWGK